VQGSPRYLSQQIALGYSPTLLSLLTNRLGTFGLKSLFMKVQSIIMSLLLGVFFLNSCSSGAVWSRIGMPEREFLETKKNRKRVHLVQQNATSSVYKHNDANWFFYFQNQILVEKNQGQRQSDFIFENRNR